MTRPQQLIAERKVDTKLQLHSLIELCWRELRNLERFSDARMLIATADLKHAYDRVEQSAGELEDAWLDAQQEEEPDEDRSIPGSTDRDEWRHKAAEWQRLK